MASTNQEIILRQMIRDVIQVSHSQFTDSAGLALATTRIMYEVTGGVVVMMLLTKRDSDKPIYSFVAQAPDHLLNKDDHLLYQNLADLDCEPHKCTRYDLSEIIPRFQTGTLLSDYKTLLLIPMEIGKQRIGITFLLDPDPGLQNDCFYSSLEILSNIVALQLDTLSKNISLKKELSQNRDELNKNIEYKKLLFHESATGLALCRLDGTFVEVNPAFLKIIGRESDDSFELDYWQITTDRNREKDINQLDLVIRQGSYGPYQVEFLHKDGHIVPVALKGKLIEQNGEKFIWSSVEDVSSNKKIEDTQAFLLGFDYLNTQKNFFEYLAKFLAETLEMDYICIDTLHGDLLSAKTLAIYFDGKFDENVEYTLKDTPCGDVVGNNICCFNQGVRHLFPNDIVLQEMVAESYIGTTLWGTNGKPIGLIATIGRAVLKDTEVAEKILQMVALKASSEIERMHALQILTESEKRYELAMQASNDGIFDWNLETNEIYYSPGWKKMLGYNEDELPNDFSVWEKLVNEEDRIKSWKILDEVLKKEREKFVVEFKMQHKDGHLVDILSRANIHFDKAGKGIRVVGTHVDITDRKATETKIKEQLSELSRWHEATLNREERIIELKNEVNQLLEEAGCPKKYNHGGIISNDLTIGTSETK